MLNVTLRLSVKEMSHVYLDFKKIGFLEFTHHPELVFPGLSLEARYHFATQNKGHTKHLCSVLATELWTVLLVAWIHLG